MSWREPDNLTGDPVVDYYIASGKDVPVARAAAHDRSPIAVLPAGPITIELHPMQACDVLSAIEARADEYSARNRESSVAARLTDVARNLRERLALRSFGAAR